ncbi:PACE efflux transporter [Photobacterium toruni]|uniref:PACE efflux transporter n=1 Tax=Photobacterium toruni TaxID=1935446 RepID=UPI002E1861B2|nr:PACE efflux transporter [Photobacterium toruni]
MIVLAPRSRKLVYAVSFEILAIILSTFLLAMLNHGESSNSLPVAFMMSTIALLWNYAFNSCFELIETKLHIKKRTLYVRLAHSILFELGLFLFTIPLYMWWYDVSLIKAISMEMAILVFFLIYTFIFTLLFDLVFQTNNAMTTAAAGHE